MCRFIETIRVENGEIFNLEYHRQRLNRTMQHIGGKAEICLEDLLEDCPKENGIFKARILYSAAGVLEKSYAPYSVRNIKSLKLVADDDIEYGYKSADRSRLEALRVQRGDADEIIIVKNGLLTDTSYSNIALYDGIRWVTPKTPLLNGTMRQSLLDSGILAAIDIPAADLKKYHKIALINAMLPPGRCVVEL